MIKISLLFAVFGLPISFANAHNFNQNNYQENSYKENGYGQSLPEMSHGGGLIDNQQSLMIGEWALRQLNNAAPMLTDYWLQVSMEQIVWQLNAVARADAPLGLVIINDKQINAFAVPAGLIGLNVGLIDKARSMDEMASVIAHEIAHVSQRHYQHRNDEKTKHLLTQVGGILAGVAAAKSGGGDAAAVAIMGAQTLSANQAASFSRSQEREADRVGMQIMAKAGYDVNAMPTFFATLDQQNPVKPNAFIPSFVLSHPLTAERLSEARDRARNYNNTTNTNGDNSLYRKQLFEQIQWRSRYLAKLTNKVELTQSAKYSDGAKLALASLLIDERQYTEANKILQYFTNDINNLNNPLAVVISAKLNESQGNLDNAKAKLTQLTNLFPERRDAKLYLVDLYLDDNKYLLNSAKSAVQLLQPLSKQNPRDVIVWQKLQQASEILAKNAQGDDKKLQQINVLRYRANAEFWQNRLENAITSLNQAKTIANSLSSNKAILATINNQIEQIQIANQLKVS